MKELTCIVCPRGCRLLVDEAHEYAVTGNRCPRGAQYGRLEVTAPTRVVTSTVRCTGGVYPRCPVKTDRPVPKALVFAVMDAINAVTAAAPITAGQVLVQNICGTDAALVATRNMAKAAPNGR